VFFIVFHRTDSTT